jgi:hypothetical protein
MDKRFIAAFAAFCALCVGATGAEERYGAASSIKEDLDRLVAAYPGTIASHDGAFVALRNGKRFPVSDGRADKTFTELLESPDIDDMFYARYPAIAVTGAQPKPPAINGDPGRVRFAPLFAAMYGDCRKNEVTKNLRAVAWLPKHNGGSVKATAVNGVAGALDRVSRELDELPADRIKFLLPAAGTYNCRTVAGSHAISMHAYGAAIDINTKHADYWRWSAERSAPRWRKPDSGRDRAHLRASRLHLGRRLVSLRYDAFRIPPGAVAELTLFSAHPRESGGPGQNIHAVH